jgi:hypothetical protein
MSLGTLGIIFSAANTTVGGGGGGGNSQVWANAIYNNLVAWWTMADAANTPTYADSHTFNHPLTLRNSSGSFNTVTITSAGNGIQGANQAVFGHITQRNGYVPRSDTGLDGGDFDFTFGGWFNAVADASTTAFLMGRGGGNANGTFTQRRAWIYINGSDGIIFGSYSNDGSAISASANSGIVFNSSLRRLIALTYDKTGSRLHLRVGEASNGSITHANVALSGAIATANVNTNFTIGSGLQNDSVTDTTVNRDGVSAASQCFYANFAISDAQFNYLVNGGAGKSYGNIVADK